MESLDPIDEQFIKFKYDLKFSTVNRREFKNRQEVKVVQNELLLQDPSMQELFPMQKELNSLKDIDKGLGFKNFASSNGSDSKSRETLKHKGKKKSKEGLTSSDSATNEIKRSKDSSEGKPGQNNSNSNSNE